MDLCRITVAGPTRRVDLSLPTDVPFGSLLPVVIRHCGDDLANAGLGHGGWVLQRLDEAPFDLGATPALTSLRDGEVLYLRPRTSQLPEMAFDDVPDVIATAVRERPGRWTPRMTRLTGLGVGAFVLALAALLLVLDGQDWTPVAAGVMTVLLLGAAGAASRALGDSGAGAVLGHMALLYGFIAGFLGPGRDFDHPQVLAGSAVLLLVGVVAGFAVSGGLSVFVGYVLAGLLGTIAGGVGLAFPTLSPAGIAAILVAPTLALTPLTPALAFRLSRVTLPPVPTSAEDLRSDSLLVDGRELLARTAIADGIVTGATGGIGMVAAVAMVFLVRADGWSAPTMGAAVGLALLLRARVFGGRGQRLWLIVPALGGLCLLVAVSAADASPAMLIGWVLAPLVLVAAMVIGVGLWLPEHRPSPVWARTFDLLDIAVIVSLLPLAFGVIGLLSKVRGMAASVG